MSSKLIDWPWEPLYISIDRTEILNFQINRIYTTNSRDKKRSVNSVHCTWALARLRSTVDSWRSICRRKYIFSIEIGAFIFNKSAFGTVANLIRSYGHRYCQIFLHLFIGIIRICVWFESTVMVFCRFGKTKVLSFAKWCCWLGIGWWCLHEMETFWQVCYQFLYLFRMTIHVYIYIYPWLLLL